MLPYHLRDDFLPPAGISLYHSLRIIFGDNKAEVCPRVLLCDLFYAATRDHRETRKWTNRIDR